ncbi:hypothetical protein CCR75_001246 [Bremia lactucae]|uniref:Methionyl-tRNA formyltransferase n=1 Tax=Bremia lactucae TaxID=4779 RepID=A0A976IHW0_BRELC|nr:hypothetical protein CCR75_001246 [Bremia lactucae]
MVSRAASLGARHFSLAVPGLPPYRVLFFGTDHVSLATLQALKNEKGIIEHIEVVCPSDRPINGQKKDTPRCGLKVYETPANFKSLKAWSFPVTNHFDVGVVYRGPAPIHHALLNGDATTGVSVIEIDLKAFDVGRILLQKPLTIKPFIHFNDLVKELAAFGADCVVATLKKLPTLKKSAKNQDDTIACKAPKLKYRDSLISFDVSAGNILHRWQALSDSFGVNVLFRGKVVKFVEVRLPTTEELEFAPTHVKESLLRCNKYASYRGPAPIHHALLNGDATTGVSVIEIDLKAFDVGRILLQKPLTIKPFIHFNDLVKELAAFGADCVVATLKKLPTLKKSAKNQDDTIACKAPKLKYRDSLISFDVSAGNILHRWQALSDSFGVNVLFRGKVVKFVEVRLPTTEELEFVNGDEARHGTVETGSFIFDKKREALWVRCADASWLLVIRLQQAGRRVGTALDFCNGYRLKNMQRERFVEVDFEAVARSKL